MLYLIVYVVPTNTPDTKVLKIYVFSYNIMPHFRVQYGNLHIRVYHNYPNIHIQVSLKVLRIYINPGNICSDNMNCLAKQLVDPVYFWKTERDSTCTNMEIAQIGRTDEPVDIIFKNCTNIMGRKQQRVCHRYNTIYIHDSELRKKRNDALNNTN